MATDSSISGVSIREFPHGVEYIFPPQKTVSSAGKTFEQMKHAIVYAVIAAVFYFASRDKFIDVAFVAKAGIVTIVATASMISAAGRRRSPTSVTVRYEELTVKQGSRAWGKPIYLRRKDLIDARLAPANDGNGNWLFAVRRTTGKPLILVRGPEPALRSMAAAVRQFLQLEVNCIGSTLTPTAEAGGTGVPVSEAADLWDYPPPPPDKRLMVVATDRLLVMELKKIMPTSGWASILIGFSLVPILYFVNDAPRHGFFTWMVLPMLVAAAGVGLLILGELRAMVLVATPDEFSVKGQPWLIGRTRRWLAEEIAQFTVQTSNAGHSQRTEMRLLVMTLRRGRAVTIFRTSKLTFHQAGYIATELRHFYRVNATARTIAKTPVATLES